MTTPVISDTGMSLCKNKNKLGY